MAALDVWQQEDPGEERLDLRVRLNLSPSRTHHLVGGMALILKYEPDAEFSCEHDTFYFGSEDCKQRMSPVEQLLMTQWGWGTSQDSWYFNT